MKMLALCFLMTIALPASHLKASSLNPYEQYQEELARASEQRQFISNDDLYGHDTNRSTSGSHVTRVVLTENENCQIEKTGPNPFFTNKSYRKIREQNSVACRPQIIAKQVKTNTPGNFCSEKSLNELYHSQKDEYVVSISSGIDFDCLCYKKFYSNTWSTIDDILHPLNLLFNGPDYHRITTIYALSKEECLKFAENSDEKAAIENAYDSKSNE